LSHLFNLIENLSLQERKTIRRTIPSIIYNPIQSCHILDPWPQARTRCALGYGYEPATWHWSGAPPPCHRCQKMTRMTKMDKNVSEPLVLRLSQRLLNTLPLWD
jgi:hypothetical protein